MTATERRAAILKVLELHAYAHGVGDHGGESFCRCRHSWYYPKDERPVRMSAIEHRKHLADELDKALG